MVKWTEVNAYSGMPVEEDAPTNSAGSGKVAMPPDAMMKKKKKTFLDARTKAYKEHQKRLEAARARREERKKNASKMNEGQLDEREKGIDQLPRQFLNPSKEVMILKKGKVIVIDKKDQEKYMRQGWELAEALSPQDKKVIDAFYFTDKPMTGKILKTDGKTLEKTGMGAQTIAKVIPQSGGEFKVVAKMDGRSTQEIVNYIKKTFPKQLVKYEGTYHIAKDMSKLKKKMQSKMKYDAANFKVAIRHIGDDQMSDELQKLKPNEDMRPIIKKAMKRLGIKENFEVGTKARTDHTLNVTPGQSPEEFDQQVNVMHKKKNSMREALAKMWGIKEGQNPFDKKEQKKYNKDKKEGKTLTGKAETKVEVEPKMEKKK